MKLKNKRRGKKNSFVSMKSESGKETKRGRRRKRSALGISKSQTDSFQSKISQETSSIRIKTRFRLKVKFQALIINRRDLEVDLGKIYRSRLA